MFSTDFIFRQQENLVDNQKCQAGFRLLCNKILFQYRKLKKKLLQFLYYISGCFGHFMTAFVATKFEESSGFSTLHK